MFHIEIVELGVSCRSEDVPLCSRTLCSCDSKRWVKGQGVQLTMMPFMFIIVVFSTTFLVLIVLNALLKSMKTACAQFFTDF